jgi:macrolide transport system ATP-binding/permease protein
VQGVTIVLVTHDPKVAERTRRIIEIKDGKIVRSEVT